MSYDYSLSHLTTEGMKPPDVINIAAQIGYRYVGLRLLPTVPGGVAFPLMRDPSLLKKTQAALAETGVDVFDLELVQLDENFQLENYLSFLEVGGELGARVVLVAANDPDPGRLLASYVAICEAAKPFGLCCDLEFMPWTQVPDLMAAKQIVGQAGQPNSGIIVDALHLDRSASPVEQLSSLPAEWLHYAQLCDGPAQRPNSNEALIRAARSDRWLPGEGAIDLAAIWRQLPQGLPVSVEVPNHQRIAELGYEHWAKEALRASRIFMDSLSPAS